MIKTKQDLNNDLVFKAEYKNKLFYIYGPVLQNSIIQEEDKRKYLYLTLTQVQQLNSNVVVFTETPKNTLKNNKIRL